MSDEKDDEMQISFQEFMLGSKNVTPSPNRSKSADANSSLDEIDTSTPNSRCADKRTWKIFKRFCTAVQNHWMDVDDQLEEVVYAISNIRSRLPMERNALDRLEAEPLSPPEFLTPSDIKNALSHDILQHEKMLTALRKLLSSMAEAQEFLGRILDDAIASGSPHSLAPETNAAAGLVDDMIHVFGILSRELYRKQILAGSLLESVCDERLFRIRSGSLVGEDQRVNSVSSCVREWPRGSEKSFVDLECFDRIMGACN